jgi:hypothetical protein
MPAHTVKPTRGQAPPKRDRPHKKHLFPPQLLNCMPQNNSQATMPTPATRGQHQASSKTNPFRRTTNNNVLAMLRKTKRGTAPGPFCNPINLLRDYATFMPHATRTEADTRSTNSTSYPHLDNFTTLLQIILDGETPFHFQLQLLPCTPQRPRRSKKKGPLNIGCAIQRITAALAITIKSQAFAPPRTIWSRHPKRR